MHGTSVVTSIATVAAAAAAGITALAIVTATIAVAPVDDAQAAPSVEQTRETMQRIFDALSTLLPASLDDRGFHDPRRHDAIARSMAELAGASEEVADHTRGQDAGFTFLARSLVSDVERLQQSYREGHYDDAQFFVHRTTEDCLTCHTRLASDREFQMASRLTRGVSVKSLPRHQRARLEAATRQFDRALATYEELFRDKSEPPEPFDLRGDLATYLTLAIRVRGNIPRAERTMEKLAAREDVPQYLQEYLASWIASMKELSGEDLSKATLERARELAEKGTKARTFPAGRGGLIYDLAASSIVYRIVQQPELAAPDMAEAFYLLGVTDAWTRRTYWVSEASFYLESAVRVAPGDPVAAKAYELLEQYLMLENHQSLPKELRDKLADLRALMEKASARKG